MRRSSLRAQVAALGVPLIEAEIPLQASNEVYEAAFFARMLRENRFRYVGLLGP